MAAGNYLERLNQKFIKDSPSHRNLYFGGISVIVCGDPAQLPPVKKKMVFIKGQRGLDAIGHNLYVMFSECNTVILEDIKRSNDPEYKLLQENIRNGIFTDNMIIDINSRYMAEFPQKDEHHCTVTKTNNEIKLMYDAKLKKLADNMIQNEDKPPILILADVQCTSCLINGVNYSNTRRKSSGILLTHEEINYLDTLHDKTFDNYPMGFYLYIGAQVIISENIANEYQLSNGTRGTIVGYQFSEDTSFTSSTYHGVRVRLPVVDGKISYVRAVYVKITSYLLKNIPSGQPDLPPNTIAFVRRRHRVKEPIQLNRSISLRSSVRITITQIPLRTGEILTPYALQGSQFNQYTINDFDCVSFYQLISRGKNGLKSIRMEKKIDRTFANRVIKGTEVFREELNRLRSLHERTKKKFSWFR